jgi:hypothetical protein
MYVWMFETCTSEEDSSRISEPISTSKAFRDDQEGLGRLFEVISELRAVSPYF